MLVRRFEPRIFNVSNEIANGFNLIGVPIREFDIDKFIFDQDQQFQTIKPVGPQIVTEVRFIGDALDIDVEMFGNKHAEFGDFDSFRGGCSLGEAQAAEDHDQPPIR
jgi:hypothetical protein